MMFNKTKPSTVVDDPKCKKAEVFYTSRIPSNTDAREVF